LQPSARRAHYAYGLGGLAFDSRRGKIFYHHTIDADGSPNPKYFSFDPDADAWTLLESNLGCTGGHGSCPLTCDSVNDIVVAYGSDKIWTAQLQVP
jgi:hypothetical protein